MKKKLEKEKIEIGFDIQKTNTSKKFSEQERFDLSSPSPVNVPKGKKKLFSFFRKKEKVDDLEKLENEVNQKMELLKLKKEEKKRLDEIEIQRQQNIKKQESLSNIQHNVYQDTLRDEKRLESKRGRKLVQHSPTSDSHNIQLIPSNPLTASLRCSNCSKRMKRLNVEKFDNIYVQTLRCKKCGFEKELVINR